MKTRRFIIHLTAIAAVALMTGCATKPYDYANYRAHPPRSILVLPPLNNSTEVDATYGYLSTMTKPLAEMGYYVFPVAVVDQILKENGLPTPGEMHQISLKKVHDLIGADAVLYVTIKQYGSKYKVITSTTVVAADAELVDVKTGILLWKGSVNVQVNSGGGDIIGDLIAAAVEQAVNESTDQAHKLSATANSQLFMTKNQGLLPGPYYPQDKPQ